MSLQIWDLFEDGNLFPAYKDGHLNDETHFAQMIALMGLPPKEFLDRMSDTLRARYWDSAGETIHLIRT
jgi:hypothetical protein